jgi:acetate kinase
VELFVYRIALECGAMASALGGVNGIVFTGGIGEHAAGIRAMVCARLGWLGVRLDEGANAANALRIDGEGSTIDVRVIPTDEAAMIARHVLDLTGGDDLG